ncbi:MAG TPA: glycosyltransferase [Chitinophagaceae bacterium]|nr:glycosyltransferase [Chitinophagaceae bacterium]
MKKVLWLASWYPNQLAPYDGDFIQRHARAVAQYQPVCVLFVVKDGMGELTGDVKVERVAQGALTEIIAYYKPAVTGFRPADKLLSFTKYLRVSRQLVHEYMAQDGPPALVHVQVAMMAGLTAWWLKKKYRLAYIITEHWTGYDKKAKDNIYTKGAWFRLLLKRVVKNASLLLPVSRQLGDTLYKNIAPVPYKVIPNVVDTGLFQYRAHEPVPFRFIHVSGMNYQKNPEAILRSMQALLQLHPQAELVMVGPADSLLKQLAVLRGIQDKVTWKGEIAYKDVAYEMQQASALILFSRYENLPCVILEAQCCGLPVLATAVGGIPEVVDAGNGILVNPENEHELAPAMLRMIVDYKKFDRKKIAEAAARLFSYEAVGGQIASEYTSLLKNG